MSCGASPDDAGDGIGTLAAARDSALAAARARIRVLEEQLGLSASELARGAEARRSSAAIAQSAELAAVRAERDSLHNSLEQAEKRAVVAARQHRNERDRRSALAISLKQKEQELQRRTQTREQSAAASRVLVDAASGREQAAIARAVAPWRVGMQVLRSELCAAEEGYAASRDELSEQLLEALARAAEAERVLAGELLASERSTIEDAEERAHSEASAWQREAALQVPRPLPDRRAPSA